MVEKQKRRNTTFADYLLLVGVILDSPFVCIGLAFCAFLHFGTCIWGGGGLKVLLLDELSFLKL